MEKMEKVKRNLFLGALLIAAMLFGACSQPLGTSAAIDATESKAIGDGKEIIAYFCDWSIYAAHNEYRVAKMPFDKLTIVNFSFLSIVDNVHSLFDGFKQYTQQKFGRTVQKYEVAWLDSNADVDNGFGIPGVAWQSEYAGTIGQLKYYKEQYPHLKVVPSIGGWTKGHMFSEMAANATYRATFVQSCITFIREYKMDGIDIDWEYPGIDRAPDTRDQYDWGCPGQPADTQNFTILMKELREALNAAGTEDNKQYILTAAVGIGYDKFALTEINKYPQYLDYINLMTYDMHGSWDSFAGHQAPMNADPNAPYDADIRDKYTVNYAIDQFLNAGVPASKLTLGLPFYSRGWKGVSAGSNASLPGLYQNATGSPVGKWDNPNVPGGCNPYFDIKNKIAAGTLTAYHDPVADASYAYGNNEFYTFDTLAMIQKKSQVVMNRNLGGAMIWEIDGDTWQDGSYELTNAVYDILYSGVVPPTPTNTPVVNPTNTPVVNPTNTPVVTPTNTPVPATPTATTGSGDCTYVTWSSGSHYTGGTIVHHAGHNWKAKWYANVGEEPGKTGEWGVWEDLGTCGGTTDPTPTPVVTNTPVATATNTPVATATNTPVATATATNTPVPATPTATTGSGYPAWQLNASYTAGDIVSYNGSNYKCLVTHTAYAEGWNPVAAPTLWTAL